MMSSVMKMVHEVVATRAVVHQLVRQHLILRYRRTVLGYFWTLINPLLMMSITALVFANLFHMDLKTFAIFMFAGMVPWNFFSNVVTQSASCLILNEGLIKKIYLPKIIFPLSVSIGILVDSILSLGALFIIILVIGGSPSWSLLFLPFAYILVFVFSFGIGLIAAVLTVFFRDLQHVIGIAMQALFFLTPIIYDKTAILGHFGTLLRLNPMTHFIDLFRMPIRYGQMPDVNTIIIATVLSLVSLLVGFWFFLKQENRIVFRL